MTSLKNTSIITDLRSDILRMEGFKSVSNLKMQVGLGSLVQAFPNGEFPTGAVHEFFINQPEHAASTCGFISGVLAALMRNSGTIMWISSARKLFPPALKIFGLSPERFVFLDLQKEKDVLWAMDESLKCESLTAVVCEMRDLDFTASRRLQLAVEKSKVTGFIVRAGFCKPNTTACVSRWRISPLSSECIDELPGVGFPKWKIELLKMRNGKTGSWNMQWIKGKFVEDVMHHRDATNFDSPSTLHAQTFINKKTG